jgi:RNA polymerase sigma-70 factor (ECF subfamily)
MASSNGQVVDLSRRPDVTDEADSDLIGRAVAGDRESFRVLVERCYDRIYRMAWRRCGNRTEAEDIAQDVCVKLGQAIRGFRGEASFPTWLFRLTHNVMVDRARARRNETLPGTDNVIALFDRAEVATPESRLIDAELWDAVRALPDQQRDAVLLVYAEDLSHAEAAAIMGCSEKTVSWHLHEARKRLRAGFEAVG